MMNSWQVRDRSEFGTWENGVVCTLHSIKPAYRQHDVLRFALDVATHVDMHCYVYLFSHCPHRYCFQKGRTQIQSMSQLKTVASTTVIIALRSYS
jgi:hypothetical protein